MVLPHIAVLATIFLVVVHFKSITEYVSRAYNRPTPHRLSPFELNGSFTAPTEAVSWTFDAQSLRMELYQLRPAGCSSCCTNQTAGYTFIHINGTTMYCDIHILIGDPFPKSSGMWFHVIQHENPKTAENFTYELQTEWKPSLIDDSYDSILLLSANVTPFKGTVDYPPSAENQTLCYAKPVADGKVDIFYFEGEFDQPGCTMRLRVITY